MIDRPDADGSSPGDTEAPSPGDTDAPPRQERAPAGGRGRGEAAGNPASSEPPSTPWHALPADEVLRRLDSGVDGLEAGEAMDRLERHGPNRLAPSRPVSWFSILVDQFTSVVVLLLLAAALVALVIGDRLEAAAIGLVLLLNTAIGFAVELRARRTMEALLAYQVPETRVVRDGTVEVIPADELVPGDVVQLGPGDAVPADLRLLEASELRTNEAPLTGESTPVDKAAEPPAPKDTPLADRAPVLYSGTSVAAGEGQAVVVATGPRTELGRIGRLVEAIEEERTPLERRLDGLGRRLVGLTLAVTGVVVGLGVLRGAPLGLMVEAGLALAIAAVPEGLPAVATIALAVGLRRMARRQALIRRLGAVEALGSTTVICTDKTGTLTAGQMTATMVAGVDLELEVTGTGYAAEGEILREGAPVDPGEDTRVRRILEAAALTARATVSPDGTTATGDPTDAALLVLARKGGFDPEELEERFPRVGEIPFSSKRKLSASFHRGRDGPVVFVKGSPEGVLERCGRVAGPDGEAPLDDATRDRLRQRNEEMAESGLRVIALAWGPAPDAPDDLPGDLVMLGLAGLEDPPAEGVRETVAVLRSAGIRTVMITGDQRPTAEAVARDVGTLGEGEGTLDGRDLARLDSEELAREVPRTGVFSRVSPEHKLAIVTALQEGGEIVAMLGDGVNDAAALKKADVGVAMGRRGTDAARETASVVLRDDRFPTIGAAVEEGRVIYENIRKFVYYLFSCNVAEIAVLLGASLAGLPLPLLPLQILWLNLVTDTFPALALAMEPGEPDIMRRPPRDPQAALLSPPFLRSMGFFALLITAVTLAAYVWGLRSGPPERAVTLTFMTLALAQLFHLGNARSHGPVVSLERAMANPWALGAVPLVIGLQLLAVYWSPLARVLDTVPLGAGDWLVVGGLALTPAALGQGIEVVQARRRSGATRTETADAPRRESSDTSGPRSRPGRP